MGGTHYSFARPVTRIPLPLHVPVYELIPFSLNDFFCCLRSVYSHVVGFIHMVLLKLFLIKHLRQILKIVINIFTFESDCTYENNCHGRRVDRNREILFFEKDFNLCFIIRFIFIPILGKYKLVVNLKMIRKSSQIANRTS
jgi:hypothetical protein